MSAPKLNIKVQPEQGGKAFYLPIAAQASSEKALVKIVLRLDIKNNESKTVTLEGIEFSFPGSSHDAQTMKGVKIALDPAGSADPNDGKIAPGTIAVWSNGVVDLDTTEEGENSIRNEVYLKVPAPAKVKVSLTCAGFSDPATVTMDLIPYTNATGDGSLILPFAPYELEDGEYIVTSAKHWANGGAGGNQIFAHDIGIHAKVNGEWTKLHAGKKGNKNSHYRIWGKPVRAVADGTVESFETTVETNPSPGEQLEVITGAGNHFWIRHGNIEVLYAHLQKGSQPFELLTKGALVKAGQHLGLAGNSGRSGGPHLHLEGRDSATNALRGLPFKNGWVLERDKIKANQSGPWVRLTDDGISKDAVAIWPASTFPRKLIAATGISRGGDWGNTYFRRPDRASFEQTVQELFDEKGRRLIYVSTYLENGERRWAGIARDGDWGTNLWTSPNLASFKQKVQELFDEKGRRLIHVMTYPEGTARRWVGIVRSGDWGHSFWVSPDRASFEEKVQELFDKKGRRLVCVTTFPEGSSRRWVGIARSGDWATTFWVSPDGDSFKEKTQQLFDEKGLRLIQVTTYIEDGKRRWVGIARAGDWSHTLFTRSDLDTFNRRAQELFDENGRRLVCVEFLDKDD
jgi:hypothetical protein